MKQSFSLYSAFLLFTLAMVASNCAVNPRCPTALLPVIEVQVNATASTHDDYVNTTTAVPCRARITNTTKFNSSDLNFPGGVEVEVRNRRLSTDLNIATTSGGTGSDFFATLPGNGNWFDFFVKGNTVSTVDKAAILELATAGISCNEVVLTRKGLMVTAAPPISSSASQAKVEVEVGSVSNLDDYITWSATSARIKWANPTGAVPLGVTVQNMSGTNRLRFSSAQPAAGATATNATISLSLPVDGSWVTFYVAGNNGNPSINDKDAVFEVRQTTPNILLAREGVMVRVRKNANSLTANERDRYLEALREVHQTYNFYMLFKNQHSQAPGSVMHWQAHTGPAGSGAGSAFLPWHRAFVLHIERLLQSSDPSVAVPYWHFDLSSPNIFNANFLGANTTMNWVNLSATNPISTWQIPGEIVGIRRRTPYGDSGTPGVFTETATLGLGTDFASFKAMEQNTHNGAHSNSGALGSGTWVAGSAAIAPQDPLFYFLHSNVDRLWAKWQWVNNRFDGAQLNSYDRQGSFTAPVAAGQRLGQYADDTLWPWDNVTGGTSLAQRPSNALLTPFPITLGGLAPFSKPTVKSTIDYRVINFAYDDVFPY